MSRRLGVFILLFVSLCSVQVFASEVGLTLEERVEDFEYLYGMIERNYPYLCLNERVTGENWLEHKEEFLNLVESADTDEEFYRALQQILMRLQNGHTHVVSAESLLRYREIFKGNKTWSRVFSDDVVSAYEYWASVMLQSSSLGQRSFLAKYIAGDYWVVSSNVSDLPVGAKVVRISGEDVHAYVTKQLHVVLCNRDPLRDILYTWYIPVPSTEFVTVRYRYEEVEKDVTVPTRVTGVELGTEKKENVFTAIIEEGEIAYIRIESFSYETLEHDSKKVREFLESVKDYSSLIIDVRGNSGGSDAYWERVLVSPLISRRVAMNFYVVFRSGKYIQDFAKHVLGAGYYFLRVDRSKLEGRPNVPQELFTEEFLDPIRLPRFISPNKPVGFSGDIVLLVDDMVYSSTETFAAFCKATGWATLVGTQTGGDGVGITPVFFSLPNSKLVIRMTQNMGLNPDGSANDELKTVPDVFVEADPAEYIELLELLSQNGLGLGKVHPEYDRILRTAIQMCKDKKGLGEGLDNSNRFVDWLLDMFKDYTRYPSFLGSLESRDYSEFDNWVVEDVKVYGAFETDEALLKRLTGFQKGDRFSSSKLASREQQLNMFGAHVSTFLSPRVLSDGRLEIIASVREGWRLVLDPMKMSHQTIEDMLRQRITLTSYNLGGKMVNLQGTVGFGPAEERIVSMQYPIAPISVKGQVSLSSYFSEHHTSAGQYAGSYFKLKNIVTGISAQKVLRKNTYLALGLKALREDVLDSHSDHEGFSVSGGDYFDLSGMVVAYGKPAGRLVSYAWETSLKGGVLIDSEKALYARVSAQRKRIIGLGDWSVLTLRGGVGWCDPETPYQHLFVLGGNNSYAAYSPGLVGNRYVTTGAEVRHYFPSGLSVGLLTDFGKVWESGDELSFKNPVGSVGVSVKYDTPVGIVVGVEYMLGLFERVKRMSFGIMLES
jgi:hypothetical protein